jgi:hypothetical protein
MNCNQPQVFNILAYQGNPAYFQIGQQVSLQPIPGTAQATYSIVSGTLPPGLSLASETGYVTGIPTMLANNVVVGIQANFTNDTSYICNLTLNIINIPVPAQESNQDSQQGLVALSEYRTSIFIQDVNNMILNANNLGETWVFADVPWVVNFQTITNYFQGLNYSVSLVNWRANRYQINTPWLGTFFNSGEFYQGGPWGNPYYQLPRPGYAINSPNANRIRISWNATPAPRYAPYYY